MRFCGDDFVFVFQCCRNWYLETSRYTPLYGAASQHYTKYLGALRSTVPGYSVIRYAATEVPLGESQYGAGHSGIS